MAHGELVLLKISSGLMEKHQMFAKEAVVNIKAEIGMHQCLYPHAVWIPDEFKEYENQSQDAIRLVSITKAEFMVLTAFQDAKQDEKYKKKLADRIKRTAATVGSECKDQWQTLLHHSLMLEMEKVLTAVAEKKAPEQAKKSQDKNDNKDGKDDDKDKTKQKEKEKKDNKYKKDKKEGKEKKEKKEIENK